MSSCYYIAKILQDANKITQSHTHKFINLMKKMERKIVHRKLPFCQCYYALWL